MFENDRVYRTFRTILWTLKNNFRRVTAVAFVNLLWRLNSISEFLLLILYIVIAFRRKTGLTPAYKWVHGWVGEWMGRCMDG